MSVVILLAVLTAMQAPGGQLLQARTDRGVFE